MKTYVNVDGEWIPTDEVKFIDIEEDVDGVDLLTFEYKGKQYKRRVYSK